MQLQLRLQLTFIPICRNTIYDFRVIIDQWHTYINEYITFKYYTNVYHMYIVYSTINSVFCGPVKRNNNKKGEDEKRMDNIVLYFIT